MKNQFFLFLLSCLFLLGNTYSFADTDVTGLDGGVIVHIENCKTGATVLSFNIPESYLNKDGSLALPIQITITTKSKGSVFSTQIRNLHFELPLHLSGTYDIAISVGDYQITRNISL